MNRHVLTAWLIVFSFRLFAQSTAFTYQGRLNDGATLANGSYDLRFALYDSNSGGAQQGGTLTNYATTVSNGLFTVTLDFGNQFPGTLRWLEIGVRTNGGGAFTTLSPRQQITSTPYAIQSANAASVSGAVAASQLTGTISSNNIGVGSITTVMLAAGAVGSNQLASGAVTTSALADDSVTAAKVATIPNWFHAVTITNPSPASDDRFGLSVAALGNDRVLIGTPHDDTGAPAAGAAYLFSAHGALLTTFTNPSPGNGDQFGHSISAMGSDRVLIGVTGNNGAPGEARLFNTNGTLVSSFFPPSSGFANQVFNFGWSVAAVGNDRVLIGAPFSRRNLLETTGAAFLFSTNGTLLTTFTNPTPAIDDEFGISVAAVGSDQVLISAFQDDTGATDAGAAYLFSTNGILLNTFTNPSPASDYFGWSVAAMGSDRVLISAFQDDTGAGQDGAAYLFSINGTLLTTFTNPSPGNLDWFGYSISAVGSDRLHMGALLHDTSAPNAGAAYVFSTNGALLAAITNPSPATSYFFGNAVAGLGSERVVIGASSDAGGPGSAYLFTMETFTDGLVASTVRAGSITESSFAESIGAWTRSGDNVYRPVGNVGIGTIAPTAKLSVNGNANNTTGTWGIFSDRRLKENIKPMEGGSLKRLLQLKGVTYDYTRPELREGYDETHRGWIAQEVEEVFPEWVSETSDGMKMLTPVGFNALAVEALRELRSEKDADVEKLKAENAGLKQRLEKLEMRLNEKSNGGAK